MNILDVFGAGKAKYGASIASFLALIMFMLIGRVKIAGLMISIWFFLLVFLITIIYLGKDKEYASRDSKEIVVDEFLGMYICLIIVNSSSLLTNLGLLVLFRIFDVFKIPPFSFLNKIRKWHGPLIDDLAIGIAIGLVYRGISYFV